MRDPSPVCPSAALAVVADETGEAVTPPEFACVPHDSGDGTIRVAVFGELDLTTAPALDQALRDAHQHVRQVTLDLRSVTFMGSSGLAVLFAAADRARESGGRFLVVRGPPSIDRLFALSAADRWLEITPGGSEFVPRPAVVSTGGSAG
jgi:anti-sigma B factor antagonist